MATPEELALNERIIALPIIQELKEKDAEIIKDLEGLKQGQESLRTDIKAEFAKGKERMDGLEVMFKNHIDNTENNHKEAMSAYTDLKGEIRDNKVKDMALDLEKKNEEIKQIKAKIWGGIKMVINGIISVIVGGLIVYFFK